MFTLEWQRMWPIKCILLSLTLNMSIHTSVFQSTNAPVCLHIVHRQWSIHFRLNKFKLILNTTTFSCKVVQKSNSEENAGSELTELKVLLLADDGLTDNNEPIHNNTPTALLPVVQYVDKVFHSVGGCQTNILLHLALAPVFIKLKHV